jgi:hypothetical protein
MRTVDYKIQVDVEVKVKVKLSLCLTKHHAVKACWGWSYSSMHS